MKKITLINLVIILSLSVTQGMDDTTKNKDSVSSTSITARSKFFKTYLDDTKSIFKEMRKWHEEDYAALAYTVKLPQNEEKLELIHDTLNKAFDAGTVTHGKIGAAYQAYSAIISTKSEMELQGDTDGAEDEAHVDEIIQEVIEYCKGNKIRERKELDTADESPISKMAQFSNIAQFILAENYNVRWLPYVSKKGHSTFRILNSQFGMKAPLIGAPLERSSYDGYLNETPSAFFDHDVTHSGFLYNDSNSLKVINFIYDCYQEADAIVSQINDTKTQALCDFFLFQVGHEFSFTINVTALKHVRYPNDLNEACGTVLEYLEAGIFKFDEPSLLLSPWNWAKDETTLLPFVNPKRDGQQLFTLMELINGFNLSKEKPLSMKEIADAVNPEFLSTLPLHSVNVFENWCALSLNFNFYNQLFGFKYFFNKNGIAFDLWKDGKFQTNPIISVFKEACDIFKREVGAQFKGFKEISTQDWYEEQK